MKKKNIEAIAEAVALAVICIICFLICSAVAIYTTAEQAKAEAEALAEQQKHIEYISFLESLDYTTLTAYFEETGTTKTAEEIHILTQKLIEYNEQQIKQNEIIIAINNHTIETLETEIAIYSNMKAETAETKVN